MTKAALQTRASRPTVTPTADALLAPVAGAPSEPTVAPDPVFSDRIEPTGLPRLEPGVLRRLRCERGLTQSKLVELLEADHGVTISQSDVSRVERGLGGVRPGLQAALVAEFGPSLVFVAYTPERTASALRCAERTTELAAEGVAAGAVRRVLMREFGITSSCANSYLRDAGFSEKAEETKLASRRASIAVRYYKPGWRDQRELARRLGVTQTTIFRYLRSAGVECPPGGPQFGVRTRDGGALLREARLQSVYSIRALAKHLKISHLIIVRLETIWDEGTHPETAERIAAALGRRADELFTTERPAAELRGKPSCDRIPAPERFTRPPEALENDEAALAKFKRETTWWTAEETCEFMKLSGGSLTRFDRKGQLKPKERRSFGTRTFAFYCRDEVKRFVKNRRDHPLVKLHWEPFFAKGWAKSHGMAKPDRYVKRANQRKETYRAVRIGKDQPSPMQFHHERWRSSLGMFDDGEGGFYDFIEGRALTRQAVLRETFVTDWEAHPEAWPRDEWPASRANPRSPSDDRHLVRRACKRIDSGVKSLQNVS